MTFIRHAWLGLVLGAAIAQVAAVKKDSVNPPVGSVALAGAAAAVPAAVVPAAVSVCLLVMARDEEALLRRHLPSWLPLIEGGGCLVGQVDDRSMDGSHRAFLDGDLLPHSSLPHARRLVYHYTFDGLGPARTLLLGEAWHAFGATATHFFLGDPDWVFNFGAGATGVTVRSELQRIMAAQDEFILAFQIYDRNGVSSRWLDWFMRARPNLRFKYRWHETLDVKKEDYTYQALTSFTVKETEGSDESYHKKESGGSSTVARYERELALLYKDLADPGGSADCRLLYYLGVDHGAVLGLWKQEVVNAAFAAGDADGMVGWNARLDTAPPSGAPGGAPGGRSSGAFLKHWSLGAGHLRRRVFSALLKDDDGGHAEMRWASALWLGRLLHDLRPTGQDDHALDLEALAAFEACIALDPERVECFLARARLQLSRGLATGAEVWKQLAPALALKEPERTFLQVPYHYSCSAPAVGAAAAAAAGLFDEGKALLEAAADGCTMGVMDEGPNFLARVQDALRALQANAAAAKAARSAKAAARAAAKGGPKPDAAPEATGSSWSNFFWRTPAAAAVAAATTPVIGGGSGATSFAAAALPAALAPQFSVVAAGAAAAPLPPTISVDAAASAASAGALGPRAAGGVAINGIRASPPSSLQSHQQQQQQQQQQWQPVTGEAHGSAAARGLAGLRAAAAEAGAGPPLQPPLTEVEAAYRDDAARWLRLARQAAKADEVALLVARALQAQPSNATVLAAAARLLAGAAGGAQPDSPAGATSAGWCGPSSAPSASTAGVPSTRAGALAALRQAEARAAELLQAVARAPF